MPRKVTLCRCGTPLVDEREPPAAASSSTGFAAGFRSALVVVASLVAIVLGTYWFNRSLPAPRSAPSPAATWGGRTARPNVEQRAATPALEMPPARETPTPAPYL